jgi:hypothetical protein
MPHLATRLPAPPLHLRLAIFSPAEKQLRRRLEGEYGVDLSDRKKLLRERIEAYLNEQEEGQVGTAAAAAVLLLLYCCCGSALRPT